LVTFLLKDEEFGFDIMAVQEIIRLPKMAKLPHTPEYVEGISNLRGVVLPIFDIRARFGMKREERTDRSRVLVIDIDGKRTGLVVDGVRQVARVERSEFEPPPAAIRGDTTDYIDGVVKLDNGERIIIALDARRVCAQPAPRPAERPAEKARERPAETTSSHAGEAGAAAPPRKAGQPALPGPPEFSAQAAASEATQPGRAAEAVHAQPAPMQPDLETDTRKKGSRVRQLVSFQVGREEFAFPMEDVREILRVQTPKEVPGAPDHLLGVLTVRGKILPIIDLRRLLRQSSFAADQASAARLAAAQYRTFMERAMERADAGHGHSGVRAGTTAGPGGELQVLLSAGETLRQWLTGFNSSSQALTEVLARARSLNEHVIKQAAGAAEDSRQGHAQEHGGVQGGISSSLLTSTQGILSLLDTFAEQLETNIREDQRIIVVDSHGFQLGLVVDHMNEVLSVPEEAIEAPPSLAHEEGIGLSGVAKLEDGNRLILLLATANLLDREQLGEGLLTDEEAAEAAPGEAVGRSPSAGGDPDPHTPDSHNPGPHNPGPHTPDSHTPGPQGLEMRSEEDQELQLVTFLLGDEEYGIPIAKIQEIDRLSNITRTPKAPRFVEGVTNLRGEVIPVLSTRSLFALENRISDDRTRVIIVDLGAAKTGLVVDSVKEVLSISSRNIAPPPASISNGAEGQFISGIGKVENGKRMIVLLDVGKVLTGGEQAEVAALALPA
jgi:purine-binding chemotaxis protein CheW